MAAATETKPAPSTFKEENPPAKETGSAKQAETPTKTASAKAPKKDTKPKGPGRPSVAKRREQQLKDLIESLGTVLMFTDPEAGEIVLSHSESVSKAWSDLAEKESKVANAIDRMFTAGAYTNVTIATASMVIPLLLHYGLFPKGFMMPFGFGSTPTE